LDPSSSAGIGDLLICEVLATGFIPKRPVPLYAGIEIPQDIAGTCLPLYAGIEIPRDIAGI
jgi:hypothetical protein